MSEKQVQNVLRSDDSAWADLVRASARVARDAARYSTEAFGALAWTLDVENDAVRWDWLWAHTLMVPIGSQTLATRGSEESMYGKFFEKMVMGSVLSMLGFRFDRERTGTDMTYWLSERGERRESDATALVGNERGVRFDIGFIGPGNPEITLDKVSRFERFAEIGGRRFDLLTIIIVDRIAQGSRIEEHAELIDGHILQMSSSLWVKNLDRILDENCDEYQPVFSAHASVVEIKRLAAERIGRTHLDELLRATN